MYVYTCTTCMYIHVIYVHTLYYIYSTYTVYTHTASIQDRITIHWLQKTLHIHTCMYKCIYNTHAYIYTCIYNACLPLYHSIYIISASPYSVRFQYKAIHKDGAVLGHLVTTLALKRASTYVRVRKHTLFPAKKRRQDARAPISEKGAIHTKHDCILYIMK